MALLNILPIPEKPVDVIIVDILNFFARMKLFNKYNNIWYFFHSLYYRSTSLSPFSAHLQQTHHTGIGDTWEEYQRVKIRDFTLKFISQYIFRHHFTCVKQSVFFLNIDSLFIALKILKTLVICNTYIGIKVDNSYQKNEVFGCVTHKRAHRISRRFDTHGGISLSIRREWMHVNSQKRFYSCLFPESS